MINLLFVHTDDKLSELYSHELNRYFKVHTAVDGLSAVRKVRQHKPGLVISDYELPFLSGVALVKFVRSFKPTAASPFIFLSSRPFEPQALNWGANEWVFLPRSSPEVILERAFYLLKINKVL